MEHGTWIGNPIIMQIIKRLICFLLFSCTFSPAIAQTLDSTRVVTPKSRLPQNHSPQRAIFRALAVPGWGQMYNRQYWKLSIVYAGLGSVTALSIKATRNHRLYTRAYQYISWVEELSTDPDEPSEHPFPEFEDEYQKVLELENCTGSCAGTSSQLKPLRDNLRRNRDLSRFGIGLVYGLSIIDAFVSAHLLDFDVDEDLTVQILPHPNGATALLRIGF